MRTYLVVVTNYITGSYEIVIHICCWLTQWISEKQPINVIKNSSPLDPTLK